MAQRKAFRELEFSDNFMFAAAMKHEEICKGVLELVLEIPIRQVKIRTEFTMGQNPDYHGIRLDVYADDEAGTIFDVEMQTTDKGNLPKRGRFYQGQMDMMALKPGLGYENLPKSFIIFICTFDPYGYGMYRYSISSCCRETGEESGDEAYKVILNTKGQNPEEVPEALVHFLNYVEDASYAKKHSEEPLIHQIETTVSQIKHDYGMEVEYMLFGEMLRDERKEGMEEGMEKGQNRLLILLDQMTAGGDADKILLLGSNPALLQEMYEKYHIEV